MNYQFGLKTYQYPCSFVYFNLHIFSFYLSDDSAKDPELQFDFSTRRLYCVFAMDYCILG